MPTLLTYTTAGVEFDCGEEQHARFPTEADLLHVGRHAARAGEGA